MSELKTKVTGAEKKHQGAVPEEVTGGAEDSSNGSGILDIDLRWNTRCNLSNGDNYENAEGMQAGVEF